MKIPFIGRQYLSPARIRSARLSMDAREGAGIQEANSRRRSDLRLSSAIAVGDGKAIRLSFHSYPLSGV